MKLIWGLQAGWDNVHVFICSTGDAMELQATDLETLNKS